MSSLRSRMVGAAAGICLCASAGCAIAQTPSVQNHGMSMQQLDNLAKENAGIVHRNFGPPVPQSSIPPTQYTPVPGFWKCMSVTNYKSVYSKPTTSSPKIGTTYGWLAAGAASGGFTETYYARGRIGFVKNEYIHPFHDKYSPDSICTFKGVQPNGVDLFDVGPVK